MAYTDNDFIESIKSAGIDYTSIEKVLAAWGNVDEEGKCCEECGGEWSGGFLLKMKNGQFGYLTGWCDYTGWGCQDGASFTLLDKKPKLADLEKFPIDRWDRNPSDLNATLTVTNNWRD